LYNCTETPFYIEKNDRIAEIIPENYFEGELIENLEMVNI
jgi:dUTPase